MLNYPKSYEMLAEEELEYTSGGGDVDFMLALATEKSRMPGKVPAGCRPCKA